MNSRAIEPAQNAPSSLDEPTNIPLMDETRPRISSGVDSWRIVERNTTETPSQAPDTSRNAADSHSCVDSAKPIMHSPKPATAPSSTRPAWRSSGRRASQTPTATEPSAGAARRMPRASGPSSSTSAMKAGASEIAPPSSTANMSSASAPSSSWWPKTKRAPSAMLASTGPRCSVGAGSVTRTEPTKNAAHSANSAAIA